MTPRAPKYQKAVDCLLKDRDALLTFFDFPAEHWTHLRTSNPIESAFATVRHRNVRMKGALSQDTARLMVFKLVIMAAKSWRRPQGQNQSPKVVSGVMTPRPDHSAVNFNLIPTVGEYFVFPALTNSGPCDIMVFEGIPGGPMDCWKDVASPSQHLERSKWILDTFLPWEAERCGNVELTDANGILAGAFAPTVRKPIGRLPSGRAVLGLADAVCLNDPITGQGSNNASKAAKVYLDAIVAHGDRPFDEAFMQATFDRYWNHAGFVVGWTNALLQPLPPPHVLKIMGSAQTYPSLARRIANGFDNPPDLFPWFVLPEAAERYLQQIAS